MHRMPAQRAAGNGGWAPHTKVERAIRCIFTSAPTHMLRAAGAAAAAAGGNVSGRVAFGARAAPVRHHLAAARSIHTPHIMAAQQLHAEEEHPPQPAELVPQAEAAWAWFEAMGSPKYWVAPMVDQSELAFRTLCRRHGSTGAYTPMLHSRLFLETPSYRAEHFTTEPRDRPLLAQFCANDPRILLEAARLVEGHVDGVDLNLGCPQRIARRGKYGAFLMDDLPLVESLVRALATGLKVPVTVKIRRFQSVAKTVEYAQMLERAGASLLAIHGRTREQKRASEVLAQWEHIQAVKQALRIPVLGNGNIQCLEDAEALMAATGVDGVMSAEALLVDPALFSRRRATPEGAYGHLDGCHLLLEYCDLLELYPAPWRMVKGHAFQLLGPWLTEFTDVRQALNMSHEWSSEQLRAMTLDVLGRIEATGRTTPVPALSARALARMEAAAALERAIEEQDREADALQQLFVGVEAAAAAEQAAAAAAPDAPRPASPAGEERAAATAGV